MYGKYILPPRKGASFSVACTTKAAQPQVSVGEFATGGKPTYRKRALRRWPRSLRKVGSASRPLERSGVWRRCRKAGSMPTTRPSSSGGPWPSLRYGGRPERDEASIPPIISSPSSRDRERIDPVARQCVRHSGEPALRSQRRRTHPSSTDAVSRTSRGPESFLDRR
jgi:hypothetical protein